MNFAAGKKSQHRITITFIVNAAGGSESKPTVIANLETLDVSSMLTIANYQSSIIISPTMDDGRDTRSNLRQVKFNVKIRESLCIAVHR